MSKVEKISIALPIALNRRVQRAVSGGQYATASEVVRDALRLWQEEQDAPKLGLERLQDLWSEGETSGPGKLGTLDAVKLEAQKRAAARRAAVA